MSRDELRRNCLQCQVAPTQCPVTPPQKKKKIKKNIELKEFVASWGMIIAPFRPLCTGPHRIEQAVEGEKMAQNAHCLKYQNFPPGKRAIGNILGSGGHWTVLN